MSEDAVLLDIEDGTATITLNNPGMRNALSEDVATGVIEAIRTIEKSDARAVVIRGVGDAFCSGGDVSAMMERMSGDVELYEAVRRIHQRTSRAIRRVYECHLPTVALLEGVAFGAGANLAIACDIQLGSGDAKMGFGFRNVGLAIDTGTSYLLPRLVGLNTAKELVFTGEVLDADRAEQLGLINHVYHEDFEERATEFVDQLAQGPTVALETSKRALNQGLEQSLEQAMTREAAHQAAVFETHDHREGASAFMERRDPDFAGE
ncbi:enoyl-CoA hydratase/isomerase family protein [Halocatena pleomorpha]|uniref:Enoyl-CoA hydratase n=1 Tax=Halocatena pleomorpha TaxID=1785090 RepID=A0A3P3R687_9EURY|nr:enoyl-CoA hydratase-related protein [Halocatena pleomorpha]RRJ28150.1 enoyl-CoA hydratase [Halocatena pleomorpha]